MLKSRAGGGGGGGTLASPPNFAVWVWGVSADSGVDAVGAVHCNGEQWGRRSALPQQN